MSLHPVAGSQQLRRRDWGIDATGLRKSFGSVPVLRGVDIRVERGTVFSLLGPNGAGKTTIVRILSTLSRPDAGRATVAGFDIATEPQKVRRRVSLTGQYAAVDDLQTGQETLVMMGRLWGLSHRDARERARDLLAQFDLEAAGIRQVRRYSGGMRRRLDLAASLVGFPAVIFLDEPTTGLDLRSRRAMWHIIAGLKEAGATIFLTTQYLEEADQLADRIALIDGGVIVAEGTAAELKRRIRARRVDMRFENAQGFAAARDTFAARVVVSDPDHLSLGVDTDGTAAQVRALLDEIDPRRSAVTDFGVHDPTLDDVFLAFTGHATSANTLET
ncbi:MAG: daunorubicin resistance transporter ATPase subunit [Frondihabitans sp.]|nr:daunorubicin resistance transporter ATPase subunit [Frondihabitans sp.]